MPLANGLRIVALIEGAKGLLVLLTGFGALSLIHKDLHLAAIQLVQHLHINPASHYPEIFLDLAGRITDIQLWTIALGAILYSTIRLIEAFGLWMQRQWAKWFGILTGGIYIPVELYDLLHGLTWLKMTILFVNVAIVAYLTLVTIRPKSM